MISLLLSVLFTVNILGYCWIFSPQRTANARHFPHISPSTPQNSLYHQNVEGNSEKFEQAYYAHFARQYGFFRTYVKQVDTKASETI
jgi:hypothetical protein